MSTRPSISLLRGGATASVMRPVKGVSAATVEVALLENPDAVTVGSYRSAGWQVAFKSFNVIPTQNGIKTHHFIRLEKPTITGVTVLHH